MFETTAGYVKKHLLFITVPTTIHILNLNIADGGAVIVIA